MGQTHNSFSHGIKAVLFDRDGTLLDLQATWAGSFFHILKELTAGRSEVMQIISDEAGYDLEKRRFVEGSMLLTTAPGDYMPRWAEICECDSVEGFWGHFQSASLKFCDVSPTPLPGALEALEALSNAGLPIGLATNGTEASARRQMAHLGLETLFCYIVGSDSGHGYKPEPGQVLGFADQLQIQPDDVLMVGDSLHDIHAGKAAGSVTLGLPTGANSREELARDADQVLDTLMDLPLLLGLALPSAPATPRPMMHPGLQEF